MATKVDKNVYNTLQAAIPNGHKRVSLHVDHLNRSSGAFDSVTARNLMERMSSKECPPGAKVSLDIVNCVSDEELQLFSNSRTQMKKKNFESVVKRASDLLIKHPSSLWAHFFFGVSCKKVPDSEKWFVPALAHGVSVNPNFLSGWQALHKHFLNLGGFFNPQTHDVTVLIVKVLLRLEPNFENWCALVGQIWDYATANQFDKNKILSLLSPYLFDESTKKCQTAALVYINYIRTKNKLLPNELSPQVLRSFQILITYNQSEMYRLGLLFATIRYLNRVGDVHLICELLNYVQMNDVLEWKMSSAKDFAYHLIYESFKTLGPDSLEMVFILKNACGQSIINNSRYFLCDAVFKLTSHYSSLIENHDSRKSAELYWGRILYLKVLTDLKLYQEAYEQILVDLNTGIGGDRVEKMYMEILIDILCRTRDTFLLKFTLELGYKYLRMYGLDVTVLHHMCFINISLGDRTTASKILKRLVSLGALDDVIYLQALLEENEDIKLDYLKALDDVPQAHLLTATVYQRMGKQKRVVKSMLEASFHFHCGITPFEWLGVYYYERDLPVKSTRYFLEAFSNYLVSCTSVNYIVSILSKIGDSSKIRGFFETLNSRKAVTTDVARSSNFKAGLNYLTKAKEPFDFNRAVGKFRKVTDFTFERKIIEMVADSLGFFGMHGSASDFYLMCHVENDNLYVYPSVMCGTETKMVKKRGFKYLNVVRSVATKAGTSPLALYTYACSLFDRALSSYAVNNYSHFTFLCQQAVLLLSRCIALYSKMSSFWLTLGNIMFTIASLHNDSGAVYIPSWLLGQHNTTNCMVLVKKQDAFALTLRCYSIALKMCQSDDINKLILFYIGLTFRFSKTFYQDSGSRMLLWGLNYALNSCDCQIWQRNNLCGVLLTSLGKFGHAMEFFKDSMLIGTREGVRDAEFNLGIVYLRLGEFVDAHEVFMYRRGGDPMDSLVWQSYMLLHRCLGNEDEVLHYLWYLLYSIKHYPSLEQGIEYLRLIDTTISSESMSETLLKKCLFIAIFRSPLFMKMSFVGNCEVPRKITDATGLNYFHYGEHLCSLGRFSPAEEHYCQFLKFMMEKKPINDPRVDCSIYRLATIADSPIQTLHDLFHLRSKNSEAVEAEFYCKCLSGNTEKAFTQLPMNALLFKTAFTSIVQSDWKILSADAKNQFTEFLYETIISFLLRTPSSACQSDIVNANVKSILNLLKLPTFVGEVLLKNFIVSQLETIGEDM